MNFRKIIEKWTRIRFAGTKRNVIVVPRYGFVDSTARVYGAARVRLENGVVVSEGTVINAINFPRKCAVDIGAFSYIGRFNYLNAGLELRLGPFTLTGPFCQFLGVDHEMSAPSVPYAFSGPGDSGLIELGANCWLGSSVCILKNVTIGHGSVIGAGSIVTKSTPPFSMVVGNPGRVIKRYSFSKKQWVPIAEWAIVDEASIPAAEDYKTSLLSACADKRLDPGMANSIDR
ncbi:MAG: acyltransferase [Terrimicrobiaceae bacterium]